MIVSNLPNRSTAPRRGIFFDAALRSLPITLNDKAVWPALRAAKDEVYAPFLAVDIVSDGHLFRVNGLEQFPQRKKSGWRHVLVFFIEQGHDGLLQHFPSSVGSNTFSHG
ncbi:MAG: hypothetical protein M2R45_04621 [Verrucomicrobia subdivision 3 bacterium]|nr:hypothetical protein [Limisphaerales bacterium]MCS1417316.1 hypothetical protein [Limisphaerales bacterium]